MSNKLNKVISRRVRIHNLHNEMVLLSREVMEGIDLTQDNLNILTKAINFSRSFTEFSIIENLHTITLTSDTARELLDGINPEHKDISDSYTKLTELVNETCIEELVWRDKGEDLQVLASEAIRELRSKLSFGNLGKIVHVIEIIRERDRCETAKHRTLNVLDLLEDPDTQLSLINNTEKLYKGKGPARSVRRGLKDLLERLNKHKGNKL